MTTVSILWTESEAATLLGVSVCSLKRLRLAGQEPPCVRIGRSPRYHPGLLEEWTIAKSKQADAKSPGHRREERDVAIQGSNGRRPSNRGRDWTRSYKRKPRSRQEALG